MNLSSASLRLLAQLYNKSQDYNLWPVPFLLPHISEISPLHWWYKADMWRLSLAAGYSAVFAGTYERETMSFEPIENSRLKQYHKFLRVVWMCKTHVVEKLCLISYKPLLGFWDFRELIFPTWHSASVFYATWWKRAHVRLGIRVVSHLWKGNNTNDAN